MSPKLKPYCKAQKSLQCKRCLSPKLEKGDGRQRIRLLCRCQKYGQIIVNSSRRHNLVTFLFNREIKNDGFAAIKMLD
jgi:hypothetical protein